MAPRKRVITALGMIALSSLSGCYSFVDRDHSGGGSGGAGSVTCSTGETGTAGLECRVVELVNESRATGVSCGGTALPPVPALTGNSLLRDSARGHAQDMASNGYFDHTGLNGSQPSDRMEAAGYSWSSAGENIAAGNSTAEEAMQQWLNSTGHCLNIMDSSYVDLGVGYAFTDSDKLNHYWVQNFGSPR